MNLTRAIRSGALFLLPAMAIACGDGGTGASAWLQSGNPGQR